MVTLFRYGIDVSTEKECFKANDVVTNEGNEIEVLDYEDSDNDTLGEKETSPKFSFKFQFQPYNDSVSSIGDTIASTSNKREFIPKKALSGFIEEPNVMSFTVKEMYLNANEVSVDNKEILEDGFLSEKDFMKHNSEREVVSEEIMNNLYSVEESENLECVVLSEAVLSEKEESVSSLSSSLGKEEFNDEIDFIDGNELCGFDSEPESVKLWDKFSVMNHMMDSNSDEFLSDADFDSEDEPESAVELGEKKVEIMEDTQNSEEIHLETQGILDQEGFELSDRTLPFENPTGHESTDIDEVLEMINDIEKLEELHLQHSSILETDAHIEREFREIQDECEQEDSERKGADVVGDNENQEESNLQEQSLSDCKESNLQEQSLSDFEESNGLETLWEHQDLIEQLKMELRKVRDTGLPTILEESESPRMSEDLKPWKIDEKFEHEDRMDELHKFYKSYRERMRKFDILNYQKMYAIGFLQLKDHPLQSTTTRKSSTPTLTSMLSQNFLLPKRRRPEADSSIMFVRELESHLETVYVGQLCLSWEFLHWQYGKARELLESDPYEIRPYNQVAGEFQQFQVLMQRFLENEPFQGPRVQNYIKNRCVLRNLLQVPVIKEDPKDKEGRRLRKDAITCSMLLGIVEESLHIFWDFVRADKHDGNIILKGLSASQLKLLDPADTELLMDVQTNLQKKEKKLKDMLRSGNCIVKRFQKHQKEQSDQLIFFSQVDLKLVSRVLKMSRITTDQLVWCRTKLGRISIVQRKIHVEPSFLLFPC
ncbi:hypothetical protein IFM89_031285 [Coptis chinensis]|uniref:Ribosomal protein L34Ae n=1 Tax=Coptis chinensis TaxID=261450 RepID=A0A835J2Z1_9MAGN|nr:hypothetical protein IFM89_031285 [Coptis chinensis]